MIELLFRQILEDDSLPPEGKVQQLLQLLNKEQVTVIPSLIHVHMKNGALKLVNNQQPGDDNEWFAHYNIQLTDSGGMVSGRSDNVQLVIKYSYK